MHVGTVAAQPAYVAPGGIAIGAGAGPVFVTPGVSINRAAANVGPGYGYGYRGVADYDLPYDHRYGRRPAPPEYGPGLRDHGYGPPPRYRRPARTSAHTPNGDAAKSQPPPHIPAPFAGQQ